MTFSASENWIEIVLIGVLCYLIGCFNFAVLISRKKHKDVTKMGSGNPGTMNMTREFGVKIGVITFFLRRVQGRYSRAHLLLRLPR